MKYGTCTQLGWHDHQGISKRPNANDIEFRRFDSMLRVKSVVGILRKVSGASWVRGSVEVTERAGTQRCDSVLCLKNVSGVIDSPA